MTNLFHLPEEFSLIEICSIEFTVVLYNKSISFLETISSPSECMTLPVRIASAIFWTCMLAAFIEKRTTDIKEVSDCFNNFENLKPLIQTLENHFNIQISSDKNDSTYSDHFYYTLIKAVKSELLGPDSNELYKECSKLRETINSLI